MDPLRAPPLLLFAVTSLAIHLGAFRVLRGAASPLPAPFDGSGALSGETLEVDPAPPLPSEPADDGRSPDPSAADVAGVAAARTTVPHARGPSGPPVGAARPPLFGAAGLRSATDLATTVTRAFPQAASADPAWYEAPFGPAGRAEVVLVLDDEGHLADTTILGAASTALRRGIERTLSILAVRSFTARAPVTRFRVTARVSRDDVHDGLHGDVFALSGGSFSGDVGSAFFALPARAGAAGRRVDVELRLLP